MNLFGIPLEKIETPTYTINNDIVWDLSEAQNKRAAIFTRMYPMLNLETKRIICLYGGPGAGKSTVCAGLFYALKTMSYECEMNREYIKDWIFENRPPQNGDQSYFFAKMARKERLFMSNNLDFIITDSPLILTHYYGLMYDRFEQKFNTSLVMLKNHHQICIENGYKIDHFLLKRTKRYSELGRNQKEERAKEIDCEIENLLNEFDIKYQAVDSDKNCVDNILKVMKVKYQ